jgi:hypothetical protein
VKRPTGDECSSHASIEIGGRTAWAAWYPQMGGYTAPCWVEVWPDDDRKGFCFDVYVWHDGEFPFGGENDEENKDDPVCLHHCSAQQFVDFGTWVRSLVPLDPCPQCGREAQYIRGGVRYRGHTFCDGACAGIWGHMHPEPVHPVGCRCDICIAHSAWGPK